MRRKIGFVMFLVLLLTLSLVPLVAAEGSEPVGGCPPNWHLHEPMHDGSAHPDHRHVGTESDRNGDGWICGKHVGVDGSIHVHTDNNIRF